MHAAFNDSGLGYMELLQRSAAVNSGILSMIRCSFASASRNVQATHHPANRKLPVIRLTSVPQPGITSGLPVIRELLLLESSLYRLIWELRVPIAPNPRQKHLLTSSNLRHYHRQSTPHTAAVTQLPWGELILRVGFTRPAHPAGCGS
jgi:hypothetical protein